MFLRPRTFWGAVTVTMTIPAGHRDTELRRLQSPRGLAHLRITSSEPMTMRVQLFMGGCSPKGWRQTLGQNETIEVWPDDTLGFVVENRGSSEQQVTVELS